MRERSVERPQKSQAKTDDQTGALASPDTKQRIQRLRQLVREKRGTAAFAVDSYRPSAKGSVADLNTPVADILRQLPGVAEVSIPRSMDRPPHCIVHLTDWHFIPKDLFAADIRDVAEKPVPDAEIDDLYKELLLEIELVQIEQKAILRCLTEPGLGTVGS